MSQHLDGSGVKEATLSATKKPTAFEQLLKLVETSVAESSSVVSYVKMLDPQFGIPESLSLLLFRHLSQHKETVNGTFSRNTVNSIMHINEILSWADTRKGNGNATVPLDHLCFVISQAMDKMSRMEDLGSLLVTVARSCPHRWKSELILFDLETRLGCTLTDEQRECCRLCLNSLGDRMLDLFEERLGATATVSTTSNANGPSGESFRLERILDVLDLLTTRLPLTEADVELMGQLSLSDWFFELKTKFWHQEIRLKMGEVLTTNEARLEAVYIFLELENKKGHLSCRQLLDRLNDRQGERSRKDPRGMGEKILDTLRKCLSADELEEVTEKGERSLEKILSIIKSDANTSRNLGQRVESRVRHIVQSAAMWTTERIQQWALELKSEEKRNGLNTSERILEFIGVYDAAVEKLMGFRLRNTQRLAIVTLLINGKNTLAQMSTGEGKSLVVAGVAICKALAGLKVDIITSNSVLAVRDAKWTTDKGGLRDLYDLFGVGVSDNCSLVEEDRVRAYDAAVVYGELSSFQRDHLLHGFYKRNIRGDRTFDFVIVDEVDSLLLDRGNNVLYLSHDIPGLETLESIFVFIWQKVRTSIIPNLKQIKAEILYDLYGAISDDNLELLLPGTPPNGTNEEGQICEAKAGSLI